MQDAGGAHRYLYLTGGLGSGGCYSIGWTGTCAGGYYVTLIPGIYVQGTWYSPAHAHPRLSKKLKWNPPTATWEPDPSDTADQWEDFELASRSSGWWRTGDTSTAYRPFNWFNPSGNAYCCPK